METAISPYHEIIDFIAGGSTPEDVLKFQPSLDSQRRLADLLARDKDQRLSPEEKMALDHFVELEHILRMAKAKARQLLARGE